MAEDNTSTVNKERERCVAHFWKSASNTPEISELTVARGIKSVALGSEHCISLGYDGQVYSQGSNNYGQLGLGNFVNQDEFCVVSYLNRKEVIEVDCGSRHSAALTSEGVVYCWGDTSSGQCGVGDMKTVSAPARIHFMDSSGRDTLSVVMQVACGELHTLGLTGEGQVWAWGSGAPLGLGSSMEHMLTPKKVEDFVGKKVLSIACGSYHSMAIVDGDGVYDKGKQSGSLGKNSVDGDQDKDTRKFVSSMLKIPRKNRMKDSLNGNRRSFSVPLPRKPGSHPLEFVESDTSSLSESDGEGKQKGSPKSEHTSNPEDICVNVGEDVSSPESQVVSTIDMGITKLTNVVMQSVSGVLSLTSSLTGQTNFTDGEVTPPTEIKTSSKVKTQTYEPVCVQVWTWGRGTCGQLGHGTTEDRLYPSLVDDLLGVHIVKVVAGTHHSLALTSYSQVYAWGDNSHTQLGIKKNVVNKPRKVKSLSNVLVWDIAAGSHYSLFFGDSFQNQSDVYVCGRRPSGLPMSCMHSLMEFKDNFAVPVESEGSSKTSKRGSTLSPSRSDTDIQHTTSLPDGVRIGWIKYFRKNGILRKIFSCGEQCICLAVREPSSWFSVVADMASRERVFYYKLALIWQATLEPLLLSGGCQSIDSHLKVLPSITNNEELEQILPQISKAFHHVMRHVATSCKRLQKHVTDVNSTSDVISVLSDEKYFDAFEKYSKVYSDAIACGVFESLGKDASSVLRKGRSVFEEVLGEFEQGTPRSDGDSFREILRLPLQRTSYYAQSVDIFQSLLPETVEHKALQDLCTQWKKLLSSDQERVYEAKQTKEFWQECPPKLLETYKKPNRRLLKSSKVDDLFPSKPGRFSSHWFVLLNDTFFHIQSNKNFQAYNLATVWASPVLDAQAENFSNAIRITTPEESFTVCSKTAFEKAQWLVAINQAVAKIISKTTSYRLSSETVNTKCGSFTPAKAREASYFYQQDPKYKGACYIGMWLSGKPHGHGKMVWSSTAQTYEGEFRNGLYNGYGHMMFVSNPSASVAEEYEGEWKDGLMHHRGKMSYGDRETYEGHWVQNVRHGHGVLRMGMITSPTPSIFIGTWENDRRSGFGVMDDIMRGEKYMGMWENDMRCGKGLIVTLDGIYNEGRFVQNKLMGHGVLLCDDNTKFEGEFCGDAQVNGKGVLTMPNGDQIEGTFQGAWNDGLKVNGVYHKGTAPTENTSLSFSESVEAPSSTYYISADKKWKSVFNECRDCLGCHGDIEPDLKKAWRCVSEELARGPTARWPNQDREVIDEVLRGVDLDQARKIGKNKKKLQEYLSKAFDLPCHPLGRLLETLVDVYRATYVGMGAHSRLLPHAVEEIKSYIDRVYAILRILFPTLPNEEFVYVGELATEGTDDSHDEILDSNTLLGPLMFPRFYPPLFTLYALHNETNDSAYWERVHQLNKRTDLALMSYLEIKRTFWLVPEGNDLAHETDLSNWKHTHYYEEAVEAFQQMSTKFSPMEKISQLRETFQRIHKEVKDFWKGKAKLMSLDDLFPVFQFVVIRARVHHLGSEIHFIEDLMQVKHRSGEQGHMFTTLKACYYQILNEN